MARTGFFHHIGTFLLLTATVLLIVTDITAPIINEMGMLKVDTPFTGEGTRRTQISLGTFGYCILDAEPQQSNNIDRCTNSVVGYRPVEPLEEVDDTDFSPYADRTTQILSRVMILHPIATGIAFIAFLLALGAGMVGGLLASLLSFLAFLTTLTALICDFISFGIIRSTVNDDDNGNGSHAYYSVGMWTTLVSTICSLIATVIVFFTCCSRRLRQRRENEKVRGSSSPPVRRWGAGRRRPWMFWRRRRADPAVARY